MDISREEITRLCETQTVEFKSSLGLQKDAGMALCSMVNAESGRGVVYFGIAADGEIKGIDASINLDTAQRSLADYIREKFDPPLTFEIEVQTCEGKNLIALRAIRSKAVPYHEFDGRAYIREGSKKRQLTLQEKQLLGKSRDRHQHNGPWRCAKCNSFAGTLNSFTITDFSKPPQRTFDCPCGGEYWPA